MLHDQVKMLELVSRFDDIRLGRKSFGVSYFVCSLVVGAIK